jgi:hypothetical protein
MIDNYISYPIEMVLYEKMLNAKIRKKLSFMGALNGRSMDI